MKKSLCIIAAAVAISACSGLKLTDGGEKVRVLHVPSSAAAKGSVEIRRTISDLVAGGVPIEFVELSNASNEEVLAALKGADLVVDQLYSDIVMPSLAKEAAVLGVPVIVAGYFGEVYGHPPFARDAPPD